jgi:YVTN family beta-propeller protein
VTATIPVGTEPYGVAVDPAAGTVYVTNQFSNTDTVSVIDAATSTVTATIPVGGTEPTGVAVDPGAGTVYVTSVRATVSVIDAATSTVTTTIPVGDGPFAVAVDPSTHTAYVANDSDNTVSVISAARPVPVVTVTSSQDPSTFGQKVTFTATIAPADGGTITFSTGSTAQCRAVALIHAGGSTYQAKCTTTALPGGFDKITAAYPGDARYAPSAATLTQTVTRAETALTENFRTSAQGLTLTATMTASGRPASGQPVSFSTGKTRLCTRDTSAAGVATCVLTAAQTSLAEQVHDTSQASYLETASYQSSTATLTPP